MIYMVTCSFRSLFWMLVLLSLLMYIVGVVLAMFVISYIQSQSVTDLESIGIEGIDKFMTVRRSMLTLLKAAFGGEDWGSHFETLWLVGNEAGMIFLGYMAIMLMAVLNVITGVFVEHTMATVKEDRDIAIEGELDDESCQVQNLKDLFLAVQQDIRSTDDASPVAADMLITEEEFYKIVGHDKVRAYFAVLGLDVAHAQGLYKLLDCDGDGEVGLDEFVLGCLRLKGEAKAVDCATLMYENKRIMRRLNYVNEHQSRELHRFYAAIRSDLSVLKPRSRLAQSRTSDISLTIDSDRVSEHSRMEL